VRVASEAPASLALGIRANLAQFALLVVVNAFVGAMVYPTLLAAISDVAHPTWRASTVGVYRLWRDLGYAVGALLAGVVADALGVATAMGTIAALTFGSGLVVAVRMGETLGRASIPAAQGRTG